MNFGEAQLWINTQSSHYSFVEFDMSDLPPDARIDSAELVLRYIGLSSDDHRVEVGRVDGDWSEGTITWKRQPGITWGGPQQVVGGEAAADIRWDVTAYVAAWHDGSAPNEGLALRGAGDASGKLFHSKDTSELYAPRLVIRYTLPPQPIVDRPDLGDAPDSSNHHNSVNAAYVGVPGQFPTVWQVPVGQPAGPRHANATLQGLLGLFITRELEADLGPDEDGPNNIVRTALGAISSGDADRDRGDGGWRNRNIRFYDCMQQMLKVRVSKPAAATIQTMYLNVWFDGTRDGDWGDVAPCIPLGGGGPVPSSEWIVRGHVVDMTSIAAGGFVDLDVATERVLNITDGMPHWMRFTLSERPAIAPTVAGALPDGRGPHPKGPVGQFSFGETEDYFQLPPPPGAPGDLVLEKRALGADGVVSQGGFVDYEVQLRHVGGTEPVIASIHDVLPLALAELHLLVPERLELDGWRGAAPGEHVGPRLGAGRALGRHSHTE